MNKKNNFQKQLKFHCSRCQAVYQLIELHSRTSPNCSERCQIRWQDLLHEYYQEKVLGYIRKQEEENEKSETD
jgi:endogenous inhibitor of DNA gyrase (YacG/DUF329 family)